MGIFRHAADPDRRIEAIEVSSPAAYYEIERALGLTSSRDPEAKERDFPPLPITDGETDLDVTIADLVEGFGWVIIEGGEARRATPAEMLNDWRYLPPVLGPRQ